MVTNDESYGYNTSITIMMIRVSVEDDNDKDDDSNDDVDDGSFDDFETCLWNTMNIMFSLAKKHHSILRIHTIPSVPVVDCFQKIRQQVKCYLQMAGTMGKQELQEGLEVIESTNLKYFSREMTAEFYALKGMFLAQVGRSVKQSKCLLPYVNLLDFRESWPHA